VVDDPGDGVIEMVGVDVGVDLPADGCAPCLDADADGDAAAVVVVLLLDPDADEPGIE